MRYLIIIAAIIFLCFSLNAAELTDYERIAISSPLITQIYTNPELTELEDIELQPEAQIKLYEEFSTEICNALQKRYHKEIEFKCFTDMQSDLDTKSWNDFNRLFTGQNSVDPETCHDFAEKLNSDGVLNTYLMFNYYENENDRRHLEVHFEWYLVDLASGETTVDGKLDCEIEFDNEEDTFQKEMNCFEGIIEMFAKLGQ